MSQFDAAAARHRATSSSRRSSSRPTAASAAGTSSRACSRTASSSSARAVDDQVANIIIAQLLFLESEDPDKDIMLYINSPGGVVTAGLAIYDTMQYVRSDVATICMGQAASMGAFLLAAGHQGQALRAAARAHHDPPAAGRLPGQATDIEIQAREILRTRDKLNELLVKHTGQPIDQIKHDTERDYFMSAVEAKEYGLIDEVLIQKPTARRQVGREHAELDRGRHGRRAERLQSGDRRLERCAAAAAVLHFSKCRPSASATITGTCPAPSAARPRRR